jgi:hypothetical protein
MEQQPLLSGKISILSHHNFFFHINFQFLSLILYFYHDFDSGYFLFFVELEQRSDLVGTGNQSGNWSSYQYLGRTGSAIPTASVTGAHVSVDEIRSAAAVSSSVGYYPPVPGALVGSPDPDPAGSVLVCL